VNSLQDVHSSQLAKILFRAQKETETKASPSLRDF